MWIFTVFCLLAVGVQSGFSYPEQGGFTGTSLGPGFAGAASGSFSGTGVGVVPQFPFNPNPFIPQFPQFPTFPSQPLLDPTDFNRILNEYLQAAQKNYANALTYTYTTPGATAFATSSFQPENHYYQQQAQQQAIYNAIKQQASLTPTNGGYAPNYAGATAAIGPGGVHQTASIYPQNPASPNVNTRFETIGGGSDKTQFFGLSTSSFSESTDVNGVQSNRRGATTFVNDNGKISKHEVHS